MGKPIGTPHEKILGLVEHFDRQRQAYRSDHYNETQLRREFLDSFWEALGWDVDNRRGYAEAYKDVIHEDSIKIGGMTKAPDYCLRIGGMRRFFLEAKKPAVNIREDTESAFEPSTFASILSFTLPAEARTAAHAGGWKAPKTIPTSIPDAPTPRKKSTAA